MMRLFLCASLLLLVAADVGAQGLTGRAAVPTPAKTKAGAAEKPARAEVAADKSPGQPAGKPASKDPLKSAMGMSFSAPNVPVTTEIYADQAFFDSAKYVGTFTGHVIVNDPRFNIQADKLTVYLAKNQEPGQEQPAGQKPTQGLEKAVAEGNVGVVRDQPGEDGGPNVRSVGRADRAVYTTSDGNVELSGTPRVQSGLNTHVATSPETVMLINQSGQLTTQGPSRTEIRQEPKPSPAPKP